MSKWIDDIKCLRCGIKIYGASGMDPKIPEDDEVSICFACGNIAIFFSSYDTIKLIAITVQQKLEIKSSMTEYQRGVLDTLDSWWEEKSKSILNGQN